MVTDTIHSLPTVEFQFISGTRIVPSVGSSHRGRDTPIGGQGARGSPRTDSRCDAGQRLSLVEMRKMSAVNVRLRRLVLCLVCGATLVTSAAWVPLFAQSDTIGVHGSVTSVPASGLIRKPASFFDLEGTNVTFTPNDAGEYAVAVGNLGWRDPASGAETVSRVLGEHDYLTVDLPFSFPFAGRTWTRAYANANGNISFQRPEGMNWPHRDRPASMRSLAAAVDSRSAVGLETMIAALWALYGDTTVSVDSTSTSVVITWRAVRRQGDVSGYVPLGENFFQARLYPSGAIELGYHTVPERDGIVGLFHGLSTRGRTLDSFDDPAGDVANAVLDIVRIEFVDNGSTVLARMTLAGNVPAVMHDGEISYRIFLRFGGTECAAGIVVAASGRRPFLDRCPDPVVVGYRGGRHDHRDSHLEDAPQRRGSLFLGR